MPETQAPSARGRERTRTRARRPEGPPYEHGGNAHRARNGSAGVNGRPDHERTAHGVSARQLLERRNNLGFLGPHELERWLLTNDLAVHDGHDGLLVPTGKAIELAGALRFIRE